MNRFQRFVARVTGIERFYEFRLDDLRRAAKRERTASLMAIAAAKAPEPLDQPDFVAPAPRKRAKKVAKKPAKKTPAKPQARKRA